MLFTPRKLAAVLLATLVVGLVGGLASAHYSGIVKTEFAYPAGNHVWISDEKSHVSALWLASNNCSQDELDAFTALQNSTQGYSQLPDFPNGYKIYRQNCTGTVDNSIDIQLIYQDCATWKANHPDDTSSDCTGAGGYGGENHHVQANADWCALWNVTYRCGFRLTWVHINKARWDSRTTAWHKRLLLHELGHSVSLLDYCAAEAAMNNGLSGCWDSSQWLNLTGWTAIDRDGLFHGSHYQAHSH